MSTYFRLVRGCRLSRQSFSVAQDTHTFTEEVQCGPGRTHVHKKRLLKESGDIRSRPPANVVRMIGPQCVLSPLAIRSPKTHINTRCEQGLGEA